MNVPRQFGAINKNIAPIKVAHKKYYLVKITTDSSVTNDLNPVKKQLTIKINTFYSMG